MTRHDRHVTGDMLIMSEGGVALVWPDFGFFEPDFDVFDVNWAG